MSRYTILLAGSLSITERLRNQIDGSRVLAADAGLAHAVSLGVEPELWLGDFDSADQILLDNHVDIPRQTHPTEKDATDGELAIDVALDRGATSIVLAGAFGGQSDHAFQHFTQIVALARRGIRSLMTSGDEEAWPLIPGDHRFDFPSGTRISIVAFDELTGLTLGNVKWPLEKRHVPFGSSLTLSNVARGPISVQLETGHAVLIAYPAGNVS